MTVKRQYSCDLCREGVVPDFGIRPDLVGLVWDARGRLTEAPNWRDVEHHICLKCMTAIQALPPTCGGGMRGCTGGPKCSSDHK